jgi:hypothetical protein
MAGSVRAIGKRFPEMGKFSFHSGSLTDIAEQCLRL